MKIPSKKQEPFAPNAGFFRSTNGDLYRDGEFEIPVRPRHAWHYADIRTGAELLSSLRAGQYAWPGGYEVYFVTADGAVLSYEAVRENLSSVLWAIMHRADSGWRVVGLCVADGDVEEIRCAHTNRVIQEEAP